MKLRLFPREHTALHLLAQMAGHLVQGVQELAGILGAPPEEVEQLRERMHRHEAASASLHYALLTQLRTSFINPLPREDLYALSHCLNEASERLDGAADLIALFRLDRLSHRAAEQLEVIGRQAELTAAAMRRFEALDELEEYWLEVLRLSKRAEHTHRAYVAELLAEHKPKAYARHREVANQMIEVSRDMRRVAMTVGSIIVKES